MITNTSSAEAGLIEKQAEIKQQLSAGEFKTLGQIITNRTGRLIQSITRSAEPLPFWYCIAVIILLILGLGFLTSILIGETYSPIQTLWLVIAIGMLTLVYVIALEIFLSLIFRTFHNYLIDAMEAITELTDFQRKTMAAFSMRKQLLFAILYSIVLSASATIIYLPLFGFSVGIGVITIALNFIGGAYFYFVFNGLPLLMRLSRYHFKLYAADPSSSEVIDRSSDLLTYGVYLVASFAAALTLIVASFGALTGAGIVIIIIIGWGPTILFFAVNQYILSRIISRAKWQTLNDIQRQVETLQAQEPILSEETLGHIDKLMDYHDRIKSTRNSALDLRSTLNFLNSLLLPLIAFM
ncbi:MAG TPA: hypothetical protein VI522_04780, partial [Gammaproteobacteria bacterium]|nr:hypothetical protein [Gammaproteobacteria bacterium]